MANQTGAILWITEMDSMADWITSQTLHVLFNPVSCSILSNICLHLTCFQQMRNIYAAYFQHFKHFIFQVETLQYLPDFLDISCLNPHINLKRHLKNVKRSKFQGSHEGKIRPNLWKESILANMKIQF
jgi:hypothetical protein